MRAIKTLAVIGVCTLISACSTSGINGLGDATTSKFVGDWAASTPCDDGSVVRETFAAKPGVVPLTFTVDYSRVRTNKGVSTKPAYGLIRGESSMTGVTLVDFKGAEGASRDKLLVDNGTYIDDNTVSFKTNERVGYRDYCATSDLILHRVTGGSAAQ
ncbi:MAG: hypothetical protein WAW12_11920 [Pseudomonas sp.]